MGRLKSDFEVFTLWVRRHFLDFSFSYMSGKRFLYVPDAIVYLIRATLSNHLNTAVGAVADPAG